MRALLSVSALTCLGLASCVRSLKPRPTQDSQKSDKPVSPTINRYQSPIIPTAEKLIPTKLPSRGKKRFIVGGTYQCDGEIGNPSDKKKCQKRSDELRRRMEKELGKKVECSRTPHQGTVMGLKSLAQRYEWSCLINKESPTFGRGTIWNEVSRRLFGGTKNSDVSFNGGLAVVDEGLSRSLPGDPHGQGFFLLFRIDRPKSDRREPGSTHYLIRRRLTNELDRRRADEGPSREPYLDTL